ncbi:MAG TPA: DotI/IcmL family type IV secretion protein [Gammaproteobacteria bacterium]|nr:DotI/IcmL family type IV secretion protein [Gammaproteobacteria bacterium]
MTLTQNKTCKLITKLAFTLLVTATFTLATPSLAAPPAPNPLATPELPQSALLGWTEQAVLKTFNLDYKNYKDVLKAASRNFTPQAWKEYNRALDASGNITTIKERKLRLSGTLDGDAKIISQDAKTGIYTWKIEMPVKLVYASTENNAEVQEQLGSITVTVVKTPPNINAQGIAINSLVMTTK